MRFGFICVWLEGDWRIFVGVGVGAGDAQRCDMLMNSTNGFLVGVDGCGCVSVSVSLRVSIGKWYCRGGVEVMHAASSGAVVIASHVRYQRYSLVNIYQAITRPHFSITIPSSLDVSDVVPAHHNPNPTPYTGRNQLLCLG